MSKYPEYATLSVAEAAVELVKDGLKAVELAAALSLINLERGAPINSIPNLIENLVRDGLIMEIEYCLPHMSYRVKSLYFPVGTLINKIDKSKQG